MRKLFCLIKYIEYICLKINKINSEVRKIQELGYGSKCP